MRKSQLLEIKKGILANNDQLAEKLRSDFQQNHVIVVNVVSSPGSGKTELLTVISKQLISQGLKVSALVGDLATDNDARRLQSSGAETHQINTNGGCHLNAKMIKKHIKQLTWKNSDVLFIENVGNLVCPAEYDLGENKRIVLMSVTEGEDKPLKYPTMFNSSDACVITKTDLSEAVDFQKQTAIDNLNKINPGIKTFFTSAKTNQGIEPLIKYILHHDD